MPLPGRIVGRKRFYDYFAGLCSIWWRGRSQEGFRGNDCRQCKTRNLWCGNRATSSRRYAKALEANDPLLCMIKDHYISTGEEEEQYWQKLLESGKNKARTKSKRGRRFGGFGRGGYGGRKRRQKPSASEDADGEASPPVAKQPRSEDKEEWLLIC